MSATGWALSEDLSPAMTVLVMVLVLFAAALLAFELRSRERAGVWIFLTGVASALLFAAAVLRPVRVSTRGSLVGPRVLVLVDQSRRLLLPAGDGTRRTRATEAVGKLVRHFADARLTVLGFGDGAAVPVDSTGFDRSKRPSIESDLGAALEDLAATPGERPRAIAVVSDGRLTRPASGEDDEALRRALGSLGVPIHTVRLVEKAPADANIRSVRAAGAAVAHQPLALTVEVGCSGGLSCREVPVHVRELLHGVEPVELATGMAKVEDGVGTIELDVTLERAGARVVDISIEAPEGDEIAENDTRFVTFTVARERVRLLHLAGRPTYDVRTLRMWLKSDESVDVVAFFILRGDTDDPEASDQELALIEFPVTELFTTHLPSFDAVILQDIDAIKYKLAQYLPALAHYVEAGGGLIMVGGPSSFAGGNYAGTRLDSVLPVEPAAAGEPFETAEFVPVYTESGRAAPVTRALRELLGDDLPAMAGTNFVGSARPGSIVLWEHPKLAVQGRPMPLLSLGEAGDGRSIALTVDGTHLLGFSQFAARAAGRAYGALWDGLIGWLMRDPRYEAARVELVGECIASEPAVVRVTRLPGMTGAVDLSIERLGSGKKAPRHIEAKDDKSETIDLKVEGLDAGGYTARVRVGSSPPTRHDFACERGGASWSDTRPDPGRLESIARATGGRSVGIDGIDELSLPESTRIAAERRVTPAVPPWVWALAASVMLGAHWLTRRRGGLA